MRLLRQSTGPQTTVWLFWCVACAGYHGFTICTRPGEESNGWKFNGNVASPTFSPSLRCVLGTDEVPKDCHLNVTDGKIIYHPDTFQAVFRGKTVLMVDLDALPAKNAKC